MLFLFSFAVLLNGKDAYAQESLDIRASDKSDYSRLVFDWKSGASFTAARDKGALVLTFNKSATTKNNSISARNIGGVQIISNDPLKVEIQIPADSKFRDFKIGNRVIVDVYNSNGNEAVKKTVIDVPAVTTETKKIKETPVVKKEDSAAIKELKALDKKQTNMTIEEPPPLAELESSSPVDTAGLLDAVRDPHTITLSATTSVGMAVFERAGYLWLVQDDPELKIPPTISGDSKIKFGEFEQFDVIGGKAYRLPLPKDLNFYGEGGGLLWRIVMTPNPRDIDTVNFETSEVSDEQQNVKSALFVPIKGARKKLTLTDPMIGDEIIIITAQDAKSVVGPARNLVDMQVLESHVGMAFTPFADDMIVKVQADGVALSTSSGLALSPKSDTDSLVLKDDIEQEELAFKENDNPDKMRRIYNFSRWQMGGLRALEQNRRVLKVGLASKEGSAKVEGLITMAKLNIANDRGPEALGLLRVAETELPGIEETPEFIALRGAARTLAGKYDEAIADFVNPKLDSYDELDYWKTAALAGVEDWKQAGEVLPTRYEVLNSYPAQIRNPIALMLSETALRAGNPNLADAILSNIEPDYKTMSLVEKSSWKYLKGELERQAGNLEQALKNWEPLLTGKDDYFRAKAGLSVTRLQLERQKITPAKAIDRLEGLRYAWRGDELETAVNFRLGQMYLENKDYLKGLSVLRNAVSLSPNSNVSQEVADYLTISYRNLFTDGTLDEMSPLDAVSIYEEFKELTPVGREGDVFVQNLAERLADVDLLGRASALLDHQMRKRLTGKDKARVANRLASIYLLEGDTNEALDAISQAENALKKDPDAKLSLETRLLKARTLSELGEASKALSLLRGLSGSENLAKLRADIAWNGGLWSESAKAFGTLISLAGISTTRPANEYQENLILNRSIALNLSGSRGELDNMRKTYGDLMKQSEKSRIFDLVTRPRKLGILDNKESIKSLISEVDLFGDFLENYKSNE